MALDQVRSYIPSWVLTTGAYTGVIIGIVCAVLYKYQDNMLYIPQIPNQPHKMSDMPDGHKNPMDHARVPYENVNVKTSDGQTINMWLMLQTNNPQKRPTLIYFHGNAGNMGYRLPNSTEMYRRCGMNVLIMDYRGYGDSTGVPNEIGLERDADATLEFALKHPSLQGSPLILFGRSLGGAVAISLAHRSPHGTVSGVILENTFLSVSHMADVLIPFLKYIPLIKRLVLRINWDSYIKIPELTCPIMFISGDSDELVPPSHMKQLFELATKSTHRDFFSVSGGMHNDSFIKAGLMYYEKLADFLNKILSMKNKGEQSAAANGVENPVERVVLNTGDIDIGTTKSTLDLPTMQTNFQVR